jgi:hypothetical protein
MVVSNKKKAKKRLELTFDGLLAWLKGFPLYLPSTSTLQRHIPPSPAPPTVLCLPLEASETSRVPPCPESRHVSTEGDCPIL